MATDNREALRRGARACLDAKGYSRTTSRDVAGAAGVSLAAIGYHFGTVDALLVETLLEGLEEWSGVLDEVIAAVPDTAAPRAGSAELWAGVLGSLPPYRGVLAASFELVARLDDTVEVHRRLAATLDHARARLAEQLHGVSSEAEPERARECGAVTYAVLSGVIVQWLVAPDSAPGAEALAALFRAP